ncbi:histidine kinase [Streptomyces sp. G5(2025)]|uniref:histidine kinase n=1 Tax=Streptomyces sp. G5(2025) TaxID=3406628 RepID=UPI003C23A8B0
MERRTRSALLWGALAVPVVSVDRLGMNEPRPAWQQITSLAVLAAAVAIHRTRPLPAFLAAAALGLVTGSSLFTLSYGPALAAFALLLGRRAGRARPALLAFGAVALVGTVKIAVRDVDPVVEWLVLMGTLVFGTVFPWLTGRYWRQARELAAAGWVRADQLEREQRIVADRARLRERARIAQDMHDSLGHELSLIAVRAGALQVAPDLPAPHREAAADLRAAASQATDRLHAIIGLLREDDDERAPLAPTGESVADLVARAAESGLRITYTDDHACGLRPAGRDTGTDPAGEAVPEAGPRPQRVPTAEAEAVPEAGSNPHRVSAVGAEAAAQVREAGPGPVVEAAPQAASAFVAEAVPEAQAGPQRASAFVAEAVPEAGPNPHRVSAVGAEAAAQVREAGPGPVVEAAPQAASAFVAEAVPEAQAGPQRASAAEAEAVPEVGSNPHRVSAVGAEAAAQVREAGPGPVVEAAPQAASAFVAEAVPEAQASPQRASAAEAEAAAQAVSVRAAGAGPQAEVAAQAVSVAHAPSAGKAEAVFAERTVHRVVQEALTNAARHAPGAHVTVTVARDRHATTVTVTNGRPQEPGPPSEGGSGLRGLRARVTDLGGAFDAGPHGDGFRVTARVPAEGAAPAPPPRFGAHLAYARRRTVLAFGAVVATGALLVGGAFAWYAYSRTHSVLDPADYARLRVGAPRAEVAHLLPDQAATDPPVERAPAPPPEGADCAYYRASGELFTAVPYFRVCFGGDNGENRARLVDKAVIPTAGEMNKERVR